MKQKIFLIGMPGAGKSTLGRSLANVMNIPFVDLDRQIELAEGMSVADLFGQFGEAHFRLLEARELKKVIELPHPLILATGGGAPCFHDNMELLMNNGFTIFLDPPLEILSQRLSKSTNRPLLRSDEKITLEEKLEQMMERRLPFYSRANLRIKEESMPAERLIQLIP